MKEDTFGPQLQAAIEAADEPMTALGLREIVGCSRQRVYQWLEHGARDVRLVTDRKGPKGAKLYAYRPAKARVGHVAIDLGATLIVTGIRLSASGERVYDMSTNDGERVAMSGTGK